MFNENYVCTNLYYNRTVKNMYELNDVLVYGTNGVCRISDIRKENFSHSKAEIYYILTPVFGSESTLYVPTENNLLVGKLRPVMIKDDLVNMLNFAKCSDVKWNDDDRVRDEEFHCIISKGLSKDLLLIIKNIISHKNELRMKIKKLHAADERALALSEKIAGEEFAYAYGINVVDAVALLENELTAEQSFKAV